jgi:hypothetical protein
MKTSFHTLFQKTIFTAGILLFMHGTLPAQSTAKIKIRIIFGTRSHPAPEGNGCEGDKGICIIVRAGERINSQYTGEAEISMQSDGKLYFNILRDNGPAEAFEDVFYVHEDKPLPIDVAEELGYNAVTIRKGEYRLDTSRNPLGTVLLHVNTR